MLTLASPPLQYFAVTATAPLRPVRSIASLSLSKPVYSFPWTVTPLIGAVLGWWQRLFYQASPVGAGSAMRGKRCPAAFVSSLCCSPVLFGTWITESLHRR